MYTELVLKFYLAPSKLQVAFCFMHANERALHISFPPRKRISRLKTI